MMFMGTKAEGEVETLAALIREEAKSLKPVDVARLVRNLVVDSPALGETVCAGGPDQLSYNALIALLKKLLRRERKPVVHLPLIPLGLAAKLYNQPLTYDQWLMLQEDNVLSEGEFSRFRELLGAEPSALEDALPTYLGR